MTRIFYLISGLSMLLYFASKRKNALITMRDIIQQAENEVDIMTGRATRGERNNNPGNLRPAGYTWQGQTGQDCGSMGCYVKFSTPVMGIRALARDLLTKYNRGLDTVRKIINAYAPPVENNTASYINAVANKLGVSPDTRINMGDINTHIAFVYAVIRHENGRVIYTPGQITEGVSIAR